MERHLQDYIPDFSDQGYLEALRFASIPFFAALICVSLLMALSKSKRK